MSKSSSDDSSERAWSSTECINSTFISVEVGAMKEVPEYLKGYKPFIGLPKPPVENAASPPVDGTLPPDDSKPAT